MLQYHNHIDMGLIGELIGGAAGVGGAIFGGISASKAMKKVKNSLNDQRENNQDWYNRRYDEDATQRADALAARTQMQKDMLARNKAAAGAQAVMGGTEESVAATKAANAQALADTTSAIVVNGERRKDAIESQYQAKDEALQSQLNDMERQKAANTAQAIQGVAQTGSNIAGLF